MGFWGAVPRAFPGGSWGTPWTPQTRSSGAVPPPLRPRAAGQGDGASNATRPQPKQLESAALKEHHLRASIPGTIPGTHTGRNMVIVGNHRFSIKSFLEKNQTSQTK